MNESCNRIQLYFPKVYFSKCIFPKCIFPKCIFPKCIFPKWTFPKCIFPKCFFPKWTRFINASSKLSEFISSSSLYHKSWLETIQTLNDVCVSSSFPACYLPRAKLSEFIYSSSFNMDGQRLYKHSMMSGILPAAISLEHSLRIRAQLSSITS